MPVSHARVKTFVKGLQSQFRPSHHNTTSCPPFHRHDHTLAQPDDVVTDVAVLGGGISGLASAYYLSRKLPRAKIVLYEGGPGLGGWVDSENYAFPTDMKLLFERGPHSLRANSLNATVTLNLVAELGLTSEILTTSKKSPAAQNRFIYYPDHLVRMPGAGASSLQNFRSMIFEPVFTDLFRSLLRESRQPPRPDDLFDESIGSFLSRRLGSSLVADNLVSAVYHGIFAGDIYQLSARSLLPQVWQNERQYGSLTQAHMQATRKDLLLIPKEDVTLFRQVPKISMHGQSVFTFNGGVMTLARGISAALESNPNFEIRMETHVEKIELEKNEVNPKIKITSSPAKSPLHQTRNTFSHAISTISGASLDKIANIHPLSLTPSVSVMVVTLYYFHSSILSVTGFGYLIPRSVPFSQNPEFALGVVFDSEVTPKTESRVGPLTKLTVMLGGHWWDGWTTYPDHEEGTKMAKAIVKRHLGITVEPEVEFVAFLKDCIPQYTVGHHERMAEASRDLAKRFRGRLRVAGSSYRGVAVHDCLRGARDVVDKLVDGTGSTGLESFEGEREWVLINAKDRGVDGD